MNHEEDLRKKTTLSKVKTLEAAKHLGLTTNNFASFQVQRNLKAVRKKKRPTSPEEEDFLNFTRYSRFPSELKNLKLASLGGSTFSGFATQAITTRAKRTNPHGGVDYKDIIQSCQAEPNSLTRTSKRANIFPRKKQEDEVRRSTSHKRRAFTSKNSSKALLQKNVIEQAIDPFP